MIDFTPFKEIAVGLPAGFEGWGWYFTALYMPHLNRSLALFADDPPGGTKYTAAVMVDDDTFSDTFQSEYVYMSSPARTFYNSGTGSVFMFPATGTIEQLKFPTIVKATENAIDFTTMEFPFTGFPIDVGDGKFVVVRNINSATIFQENSDGTVTVGNTVSIPTDLSAMSINISIARAGNKIIVAYDSRSPLVSDNRTFALTCWVGTVNGMEISFAPPQDIISITTSAFQIWRQNPVISVSPSGVVTLISNSHPYDMYKSLLRVGTLTGDTIAFNAPLTLPVIGLDGFKLQNMIHGPGGETLLHYLEYYGASPNHAKYLYYADETFTSPTGPHTIASSPASPGSRSAILYDTNAQKYVTFLAFQNSIVGGADTHYDAPYQLYVGGYPNTTLGVFEPPPPPSFWTNFVGQSERVA